MACNFNIKVVEQNDFTICIPLKKRTFVASIPIDEDIDILALDDLSVKIGGAVFPATRDAAGVMVDVSRDALVRGTYDVVLTATYKGHAIKAAYFDSLTIVEWNYQSDAQQCVQGSPIVFEAGFVIYNLTDAELAALKEEYRLKIAAAQQAKNEAEQAKEEYIAKAEALDDVAQQTTLVQGVSDIREDISHIDIDTSNLAKQGSNAGATLTDTQAAAQDAKTAAEAAKQAAEASAQETTAQSILAKANAIVNSHIYTGVSLDGYTFTAGFTPGIGDILFNMKNLTIIYDDKVASITKSIIFDNTCQLQSITMTNVEEIAFGGQYMFSQAPTSEINLPKLKKIGVELWIRGCDNLTTISLPELLTATTQRLFYFCQHLVNIEIPKLQVMSGSTTTANLFDGCTRLENVTIGQNVSVSFSLASWNPTAISSDTDAVARILANIRNNIAANLPDRTGLSALTITLSVTIKTMINNESGGATAAAFSNKNWTIA